MFGEVAPSFILAVIERITDVAMGFFTEGIKCTLSQVFFQGNGKRLHGVSDKPRSPFCLLHANGRSNRVDPNSQVTGNPEGIFTSPVPEWSVLQIFGTFCPSLLHEVF